MEREIEGEREREKEHRRGWGPRALQACSLLVNLKHNSWNLKCEKRKKKKNKKKPSDPNGQFLKSTKISNTKEPLWGQAAWLFI